MKRFCCHLARHRLNPIAAALLIVTVGLLTVWLDLTDATWIALIGSIVSFTNYRRCGRQNS